MRWGACVVAAMLLGPGCGSALVLHAEVPRPAAIPARSFPTVFVAASAGDESSDVTSAIVDHLQEGATDVVRVPADALLAEAARGGTALAVLVRAELTETTRTQMSSMPSMGCAGGMPCYGYATRMPVEVLVEVGTVLVRALDPHSGVELGRATLIEEESEPSPLAARLAVMDRLRARAPLLFDVRHEVIDLELDELHAEPLRHALEAALEGRIHEARTALEARAPDEQDDEWAAWVFDLGQFLRVDVDASAPDPVAEEAARLDAAEARLVDAIQRAPTERHARALTQLRAERVAREDVRAQQAAAVINFGPSP